MLSSSAQSTTSSLSSGCRSRVPATSEAVAWSSVPDTRTRREGEKSTDSPDGECERPLDDDSSGEVGGTDDGADSRDIATFLSAGMLVWTGTFRSLPKLVPARHRSLAEASRNGHAIPPARSRLRPPCRVRVRLLVHLSQTMLLGRSVLGIDGRYGLLSLVSPNREAAIVSLGPVHARSAAGVLACLSFGLAACYAYVPAPAGARPVGVAGRVRLTDAGAVAIGRQVGELRQQIAGRLLDWAGDTLLLSVPASGAWNRGGAVTDTLHIPVDQRLGLDLRRLSATRTALVSAGIVSVVGAVVVEGFRAAGGGGTRPGTSNDALLVPLLKLQLRSW